jgi:cytochrome c peroxidase
MTTDVTNEREHQPCSQMSCLICHTPHMHGLIGLPYPSGHTKQLGNLWPSPTEQIYHTEQSVHMLAHLLRGSCSEREGKRQTIWEEPLN